MAEQFAFDIFLCHAPADLTIARQVANRLKKERFHVWFEAWRRGSEEDIEISRGHALEQSRVLVLFVSASAREPKTWASLEAQTFLFRDPENHGRRLVPLILDGSQLPESFRAFAFVDWTSKGSARWANLFQACAAPQRTYPLTNSQSTRWEISSSRREILALSVSPTGDRGYCLRSGDDVEIWDLQSGRRLSSLKSYCGHSTATVLTSGGDWLFDSGSQIEVWTSRTGSRKTTISTSGVKVHKMSTDSSGTLVAAELADGSLSIWRPQDVATIPPAVLTGLSKPIFALSSNGSWATVLSDGSLVVAQTDSNGPTRTSLFTIPSSTSIAIDDEGKTVLVGSADGLIQILDITIGRCVGYLEGHKRTISVISLLPSSSIALSASHDGTVRVWNIKEGTCLLELTGSIRRPLLAMAATKGAEVVVAASEGGLFLVWNIDLPKASGTAVPGAALRYTNAKVLLAGESGVGKSGLAYRLVHDEFVPTSSTDGTWATQLRLPYDDRPTEALEREIWLWDFAGQADYRLIHQLFFDETALAILIFNPQSEDPFEGLAQWDNDLLRASSRSYRKLLVAARIDRGRLIVSQKDVDRFVADRGFVRYLETSALTGAGCSELRQAILSSIAWQDVPWTASPRVFKLLKDAIISLKDEVQRGDAPIVLRTIELKQQLELRLISEKFSLEELETVVGLLAGPGIIWRLSFGDFVLLQPEKINAYAAAVVRSVRTHPDEIGVILEDKILNGDLEYADLKRLPRIEELIVLRAMHQTLVDRGLCLRQHSSRGTLLLFPSYFRRQRPDLQSHPAPLVSYRFRGALDEIYATLVVRLIYTSTFEKHNLWRFAADFLTPEGRTTGFKMTKLADGLAELTVYCDPLIPDDTKVTFIRYIHDQLAAKDPKLERERHYTCPMCQAPVENSHAVKRRLARGERDIACSDCEARMPLIDLIEQRFASVEILGRAKELEATASAAIDNESKELILLGHAFAVAGEAGQIFRPTPNADWGVDGEIEFKDLAGRATGARVYLQLKSGDSYLLERRSDGEEIFRVKNKRHLEYWRSHAYPVMLVVRNSDGRIRWMDVTSYLLKNPSASDIVFKGEPFTASSLRQLRSRVISKREVLSGRLR